MCYYAFIRYACGCAPLDPVIVPTGLMCPRVCHDKTPTKTNYGNHKYLDYNCGTCQAIRDLNGRPRRPSSERPPLEPLLSRRQRDERERQSRGNASSSQVLASGGILTGRARADALAASLAARNPSAWIELGDGQFRRKNAKDRKEDARIAKRAEWAAASRRREREREEEEAWDRRGGRY